MTTVARLKMALAQLEYSGPRARSHGIVTRAFHWLAGGLLVYGLLFPADVADLSNPAALAREIKFALALGSLFLVRLAWVEVFGGGSRLPPSAPLWERILSRGVHYGVYALVFAIVASGLAIASTAPRLFGWELAFLSGGTSQETLLELHEALAGTLVLLIGVHIVGATWHWIARQDGVWQSMLWASRRYRDEDGDRPTKSADRPE